MTWILMMISDLVIPVILLVFGRLFTKESPGKINKIYGYRTKRSMANDKTWEFAHKYSGRIMLALGLGLLAVSWLPLVFVFGKENSVVGLTGVLVMIPQVLSISLVIIFTERALKKNFDEEGNRITEDRHGKL